MTTQSLDDHMIVNDVDQARLLSKQLLVLALHSVYAFNSVTTDIVLTVYRPHVLGMISITSMILTNIA